MISYIYIYIYRRPLGHTFFKIVEIAHCGGGCAPTTQRVMPNAYTASLPLWDSIDCIPVPKNIDLNLYCWCFWSYFSKPLHLNWYVFVFLFWGCWEEASYTPTPPPPPLAVTTHSLHHYPSSKTTIFLNTKENEGVWKVCPEKGRAGLFNPSFKFVVLVLLVILFKKCSFWFVFGVVLLCWLQGRNRPRSHHPQPPPPPSLPKTKNTLNANADEGDEKDDQGKQQNKQMETKGV